MKDGIRYLSTLLLCFGLVVLSTTSASADAADKQATQGCLCVGTVGNVDCDPDDIVDVNDITILISFLFLGGDPPRNYEEANADGDSSGSVDVGDLTALIDFLFLAGSPPPKCQGTVTAPPETSMDPEWSPRYVYINSPGPGDSITGVRVRWAGVDSIDHPYGVNNMRFEWRLYGPYFTYYVERGQPPDTTYQELLNTFLKRVYQRPGGQIYFLDSADTIEVCDTVFQSDGDSTLAVITCESLAVDTITSTNDYGVLDTILDVDDPAFVSDARFNRLAASSAGPDTATSAIIYDAYNLEPSDTTEKQQFIFWVRAEDPDSAGYFDPTPTWQHLTVVDPVLAFDLAVVDMSTHFSVNAAYRDSTAEFWKAAVSSWQSTSGAAVEFDPARDYLSGFSPDGLAFDIMDVLSYRSMIIVDDNTIAGAMLRPEAYLATFDGAELGRNIWICGRSILFGNEGTAPISNVLTDVVDPADAAGFSKYFGLDQLAYTGWFYMFLFQGHRVESFVGASASLAGQGWSDLVVDTALLHRRYKWDLPWMPSIAAYPAVGSHTPSADAEVLYRYTSRYGDSHPVDSFFNFQNDVVMHRLDFGTYRTAWSDFTPLIFDSTSAQVLVDSMLNWLLETASSGQ